MNNIFKVNIYYVTNQLLSKLNLFQVAIIYYELFVWNIYFKSTNSNNNIISEFLLNKAILFSTLYSLEYNALFVQRIPMHLALCSERVLDIVILDKLWVYCGSFVSVTKSAESEMCVRFMNNSALVKVLELFGARVKQ